MIPGPVAPRVPVDPAAHSPQKPDGDPGRPEEGLSFADLLQAMLAPGAAAAATPEPPAPETPGAVFERFDAAQMFNETGLFRGAAPLTDEGVVGAREPPASGEPPRLEASAAAAPRNSLAPSPGTGPAAPEGQARAPAITDLQTGRAAGSVPASAAPASSNASRAARSLPGQPVAALQTPVRTAEAARGPAAAGRRSETAAMLVQAYLARGGSAAAQVSVQAVEGGISLVARADKLSREERDKLRTEIGELLARHGLAAAEIMLNGEAGPSPKGRHE